MSPHAVGEFRLTTAAFGGLSPPVHAIASSCAEAESRRVRAAGRVILLDARERGVRGRLARLCAALTRRFAAPAAAPAENAAVAA